MYSSDEALICYKLFYCGEFVLLWLYGREVVLLLRKIIYVMNDRLLK